MELQELYEQAYVNAERRIDLLNLLDRLQLMLFTFKPEHWERDMQTLYDIKKVLRHVDCHQQGYVDGIQLKQAPDKPLHFLDTMKCQNLFFDLVSTGVDAEKADNVDEVQRKKVVNLL